MNLEVSLHLLLKDDNCQKCRHAQGDLAHFRALGAIDPVRVSSLESFDVANLYQRLDEGRYRLLAKRRPFRDDVERWKIERLLGEVCRR